MRVHIFKSPHAKFAFTEDETGSNLPVEGGPWQPYKEIEMADTDKRIGMDSKQAIEEITTEGYFIVPAGIGEKSA